jgi:hypothetical protein
MKRSVRSGRQVFSPSRAAGHCAIGLWRTLARAVVGTLALCSLLLLIAWHDSAMAVHLDPPVASAAEVLDDVSIDHDHVADAGGVDIGNLVHQAAHSAHQVTITPDAATFAIPPTGEAGRWAPLSAFPLRSLTPKSLLRPPRA